MSRNPGFGRRVKERREELGGERNLLADATGIARRRLKFIEFGYLDESDLTKHELARLAENLQCDSDWLIYGDQSPVVSLGIGIIANRSRGKGALQPELALSEVSCAHCHGPLVGTRCGNCGHPNS